MSVLTVVTARLAGNVRMFHVGPTTLAAATPYGASGTKAKFTYLAAQTSSNSSLQPATVKSFPDNARIQGSCCSPMHWDRYQEQVRDLRIYRAIPTIPSDTCST